MPIRQGSDGIEHRYGQFAEDHFAETIRRLLLPDELILPQIMPVIVDTILLRAPSGLELPETTVAHIGPAETEALEAALRQTLDCFPHHKVVCAKLSMFEG